MSLLRFGSFEIDRASGELRKHGRRVRLRDQPLRLLLALVEHAGTMLTRDDLRHRLWPDGTFVDFDRAINKAVSELRSVLGDDASRPRFIETYSKRGYRFVAPIENGPHATTAPQPGGPSEARVAYLTGRYLWSRRTIPDLAASAAQFERALELDESSALARVGLADVQLLRGIWGLEPPDAAFGAVRRAASDALDLDPNAAEAHTSVAAVLTDYEWDWEQADARYRQALSTKPDYATAHQFYAQMLVVLGRDAEAVSHIEQARCADPVSPAINSYLPCIYLALRRYDRALVEAQRAVDLEPHAPLAHWALGRAHLFANDPERAVRTLQYAVSLVGAASMWTAQLSYARARAGDRAGAMQLLGDLLERGRRQHVPAYDLAIAFTGVGDRDAALDQLERAFDQREMRVINLGDPELDALHGEPRYRRLLERLRLPARV